MTLRELFASSGAEIAGAAVDHLLLVGLATAAAALAGVPLGVMLSRRPALRRPVLGLASVLQTVPSLALFGLLIPVLGSYGIGRAPALIALFLYGLLPIVRNTATGILGVDPAVREAARGMGMTDRQLLVEIELPLALPVITAGVRTAAVISVGTATIAAAVGAGGLGTFIFRGLRMNDDTLILAGAVPAALLALLADGLLGGLERALAPGAPRRKRRLLAASAAAVAIAIAVLGAAVRRPPPPPMAELAAPAGGRPVVVCSKDFTEQLLLGELVAQSLERAGVAVERRFELGGDLCHRGLVSGEIDLYVEYTGTALTTILKQPPRTDPREVYAIVAREYPARFGAEWGEPLGFDNTFAVLVRGADARRLALGRISDLAAQAPGWRAAFGQDFMSREDGWPGLARAYGLAFAESPKEMDLALTYRALAAGQVDVIAGNSTDGLIEELDLVQLADDRRYFPPYEAAPVARRAALDRHPPLRAALGRLAGRIPSERMRKLNLAVDGRHRDVRTIVAELLEELR